MRYPKNSIKCEDNVFVAKLLMMLGIWFDYDVMKMETRKMKKKILKLNWQ